MKIGVTGGIGSGKSFVVSEFEKLGAVAYHADARAKELVYLPEVRAKILRLLGEEAYINEQYNTKYIAKIVFEDSEMLHQLNAIIHPAVFHDLDKFCRLHNDKVIVYESALMMETGHAHLFDRVIFVTAPIDVRIQRVMERDHISKDEVIQRMNNQWTDDKKIPLADYVIENTNREKTIAEVKKIWENL